MFAVVTTLTKVKREQQSKIKKVTKPTEMLGKKQVSIKNRER